jgi:uncharacterized protein YndB with AHSA1/START domain
MPYTFTLRTTIPASAQDIYDAWLDSVGHSEMTGAEASMSDEIDAEVSAWDGYITGRNIELVSGERIVQSWRTTDFTDDQEDSMITVMLEESDGETLLTLIHSHVPESHTGYQRGGWQERYFEPMIEYFTRFERGHAPDDDAEDAEPAPIAPPDLAEASPAPERKMTEPEAAPTKPKSKRAPAPSKPPHTTTAKSKAKAKAKSKSKSKGKTKSKAKAKPKAKLKSKSKAKTKRKVARGR